MMQRRPSHTADEDCDTLLRAIESRLCSAVGSTLPAADVVAMNAPMYAPTHADLRAEVLECVQALSQLRTMLAQERQRRGDAAGSAADAVQEQA